MSSHHPKNLLWAEKALEYAQQITSIAPGRGSATQAEAQAATLVQEHLKNIGFQDIRLQAFLGLRSFWLFISLAFGLALAGHGAFWLLAQPIGIWPALAVTLACFAFGGYILWRKFTFRSYPLQSSLPHGPSQNILAVIPPAGESRQQIVLVAHLDSHRAVWWFASDFLVKAMTILTPLGIFGMILAPLLYLLADLTGWMGLTYLTLILAVLHFVAWFTGVTADLGAYSPGANDNASAVGSVLALAERLKEQPLQHTQVWLAFTGCEETGCDGMRAFLGKYGTELKKAIFLDFELVGIGERLAYLKTEGVIRPRRISPELEKRVLSVGAEFAIQPLRAAQFGAFTEGGAAWEYGFEAVCLLVLRQGSSLLPEWHRLTDRADRLQASALEKAHHFAWNFLAEIDQG
jgi:hypothetical protein